MISGKKCVVDQVLDCIRSSNCQIWYSSPCTGGCSFNNGINWAKGSEYTRNLILWHWKNHDRMWCGFKRVAAKAASVRATVSLEWSHRCSYHRLAKTRQLIDLYKLEYRKVPGCSVGLVSGEPQTIGKPLCKAWGVWSNNQEVLCQLSKLKCSKDHQVVAVQGRDTLASGSYTNQFAKILHAAFRSSISWDSTTAKYNLSKHGRINTVSL